MKSKTKKPTAPKWFKGMIYTKGETVKNPFSGESYDLTGLELSIYDFIVGCQMVFESDERPEDIRFSQSLDFSYGSDAISEVSGTSTGSVNDIGILVDGSIVILPRFAGAYTQLGENIGNKFNFLSIIPFITDKL